MLSYVFYNSLVLILTRCILITMLTSGPQLSVPETVEIDIKKQVDSYI